MGRIKTMFTKRTTEELLEKHPDSFTTSFEENKKRVSERLTGGPSKKIRNIIAGYVSRRVKQKQAQAL